MPFIHSYYHSGQKRLFDILVGGALLLATLPLIALAVTWVFGANGGPLFFTQKRLGKDKSNFTLYKIRTMFRDAERNKKKYLHLNQAPLPMFKIFDDPRFIKGGKFLSSTGIDELPQLLNVLKGEMSLVGPRPLPVSEGKKLSSAWQFRFLVKPGLFSEWTTNEQRHDNISTWKKLESETLKKGSMSNDFSLITSTILKTLLKASKKVLATA